MSATAAFKNSTLDQLDGKFISLHTGVPGEGGANEVSGGSYARSSEPLGAAVSGVKTNAADFLTTPLPAATITHFGVWSSSSGGTFLWSEPLAAPITVAAGTQLLFLAGDLEFTAV